MRQNDPRLFCDARPYDDPDLPEGHLFDGIPPYSSARTRVHASDFRALIDQQGKGHFPGAQGAQACPRHSQQQLLGVASTTTGWGPERFGQQKKL